MTDMALEISGLWLGTRKGAGGTGTPDYSFFFSLWLHGQEDGTWTGAVAFVS